MVPPVPLGIIERGIGGCDYFLWRGSMIGETRYSGGNRDHAHRLSLMKDSQLPHSCSQVFGARLSGLEIRGR